MLKCFGNISAVHVVPLLAARSRGGDDVSARGLLLSVCSTPSANLLVVSVASYYNYGPRSNFIRIISTVE